MRLVLQDVRRGRVRRLVHDSVRAQHETTVELDSVSLRVEKSRNLLAVSPFKSVNHFQFGVAYVGFECFSQLTNVFVVSGVLDVLHYTGQVTALSNAYLGLSHRYTGGCCRTELFVLGGHPKVVHQRLLFGSNVGGNYIGVFYYVLRQVYFVGF